MIPTENLSVPSFGPSAFFEVKKYAVRYMKVDISNLEQLAQLEVLETRGLEGKDIVIMSKDHYSFMRDYFIVVNYLEKKTAEQAKDSKPSGT